MLKQRIIPSILCRDGNLVKGRAFDSWRSVGTPTQAIRVHTLRQVDELLFLDVSATRNERGPDLVLIDELADDCSVPLTVGGGVRSVDDVRALLRAGADKVAINTQAALTPELVRDASREFGSQCVVASVDYRWVGTRREVFVRSGTQATGLDPVAWCRELERSGAGEVILTSIDHDGCMCGYDLSMIDEVSRHLGIPVIASGGAAEAADAARALAAGASAVAMGSMFLFTEITPRDVKAHLRQQGFATRR